MLDVDSEQWVEWNAQDYESWYERVQSDFGLNARLETQSARSANK